MIMYSMYYKLFGPMICKVEFNVEHHTAAKQRAGSFRSVPTSAVHPALYPSDIRLQPSAIFMNKERFHNALALSLGYQRIINDKRINISIDDKRYPDDVMVSISVDGFSKPICYKASEGLSQNDMDCLDERGSDDIKIIIDAVHQAYIEATTNPF